MDEQSDDPFNLRNDLLNLARKIGKGHYALSLAFLSEDARKHELKDCMEIVKWLDEAVNAYWTAHRRAIYRKQNEEGYRWN